MNTLRVECCAGGEEALGALQREPADLVISDLTMPRVSGLDLLERINRDHPGTDVVFLTANATVDSAVEALRRGAFDYLQKPIQPPTLAHTVQRALTQRWLAREHERLEGAVEQLRLARETADACLELTRCLDAGEVYPKALEVLLRATQQRRALALFRRASDVVSDGVAFRGFEEGQARELRRLLVDEKRLAIEGIGAVEILSGGPLHDALREVGVACGEILVIPLRGEEAQTGLLAILEGHHPFHGAPELERGAIVAEHANLALANCERYQQAKERAFIDDVTELYNARYLHEALQREIQRAERYSTELSVLFLDLDRFKLVNDQHGHLVGSRALRELGRVLADCVRQIDTLARYGGDEFTILLVDTGFEGALQVAERIRQTVQSHVFEGGSAGSLQLTVSVGVATFPQHGRASEELLDRSDKAMYRAKSVGRNRVCTAEEIPS